MVFREITSFISEISAIAQHHKSRSLASIFAIGTFVKMIPVACLVFILHGVGDIEVVEGATADNALCCAGRQCSQRGRGVLLVTHRNLVALFLVIIQSECIFMATGGLGRVGVELILFYHRAVVCTQGIQFFAVRIGRTLWQRLTHNLPPVAVEQHEHWRDVGTDDVESTVAHFECLEPMLQLLHNLFGVSIRLIVVSVPAYGVSESVIAVPVGLSILQIIS